jgi:hypothetical protein
MSQSTRRQFLRQGGMATLLSAWPAHGLAVDQPAASGAPDLLVLEDPHKVDAQKIKDIRVARTVVGGRTVHPKAVSISG